MSIHIAMIKINFQNDMMETIVRMIGSFVLLTYSHHSVCPASTDVLYDDIFIIITVDCNYRITISVDVKRGRRREWSRHSDLLLNKEFPIT